MGAEYQIKGSQASYTATQLFHSDRLWKLTDEQLLQIANSEQSSIIRNAASNEYAARQDSRSVAL